MTVIIDWLGELSNSHKAHRLFKMFSCDTTQWVSVKCDGKKI
jgi:hypothetical protein